MEKEKYMIGQELIEIFEKVLKTENISVARKRFIYDRDTYSGCHWQKYTVPYE